VYTDQHATAVKKANQLWTIQRVVAIKNVESSVVAVQKQRHGKVVYVSPSLQRGAEEEGKEFSWR